MDRRLEVGGKSDPLYCCQHRGVEEEFRKVDQGAVMDELEGAGRRGQEVEPTGGSGNDWGLDMDLS